MRKLIYVFLLVGLSSGCATMEAYQGVSSGKVGCPPKEIIIKDVHNPSFSRVYTWTAECKAERYYCTALQQIFITDISCAQAKVDPNVK